MGSGLPNAVKKYTGVQRFIGSGFRGSNVPEVSGNLLIERGWEA
jgi:hypothetical protein